MNKIQADGIPAVFREPQFAEDVLRETAQTTGVAVGVIRSLVDDTESTYLTMMRQNARSMVENLK
jgi:ABC-type Zn uptake system ZnuABC Zn-binding protein ZnuA